MNQAAGKLHHAWQNGRTLLSVGLEPSPKYLPPHLSPTIEGYREFLFAIIRAGKDRVAAYKANHAFFEALGPEGIALLEEIRREIPPDTLFISDAKRGDIGSTAERYAEAIFGRLNADAVTLNPLMGRDSAAPFLDYPDKLSIFLALTSNPSASDFLLEDRLYLKLIVKINTWSSADNIAYVVGATKSEHLSEIRRVAPQRPLLIPGLGAQGGSLVQTIQNGMISSDFPGLILHLTRGILPENPEPESYEQAIGEKIDNWNEQISKAIFAP